MELTLTGTGIEEQIQSWIDRSPPMTRLGLHVASARQGSVTLRLPLQEHMKRATGDGEVHGGVVATFIDLAGDLAIATQFGRLVPTINFRVDFLRPAAGAFLSAVAVSRKLGRSVSVADVDVHDESGRLVAVGRATYATLSKG